MPLDPKLTAYLSEVRPHRLLITTGAGISADSGIQTYRGENGLWKQLPFEKMATHRAFEEEPRRIWNWYQQRRDDVRSAEPNAAHRAVVQLVRATEEALVITQNVDDLHERAGLPEQQLVHIHGRILETRCEHCQLLTRADPSDGQRTCPRCSEAALRPNVVWFDEELDPREVARVDSFLARGPCDLVLVIGTTAAFDYIRHWVTLGAGQRGGIVDVNPERSVLVDVAAKRSWHVKERASVALPEIARALA